MSIKPKWAKELYSGKKTVEFRKTAPQPGSIVFLYESAPVQAVTGVLSVLAVVASEADVVWSMLAERERFGSLTLAQLRDYAGGRTVHAIVTCAWRFSSQEQVKLEKFAVRPPQSWQSLRATNSGERCLALHLIDIYRRVLSEGGGK